MSNITRITTVLAVLSLLGSHAAARAARITDAQRREAVKAREGREPMLDRLLAAMEGPQARPHKWTRRNLWSSVPDKRADEVNRRVYEIHEWPLDEDSCLVFAESQAVQNVEALFTHMGREPIWTMPTSAFGKFSLLCEHGFALCRLPTGGGWGWWLREPTLASVGVVSDWGGTAPWFAGDGNVPLGNKIKGL